MANRSLVCFVVRTLVSDPHAVNRMESGWAPLHVAAIESLAECAELLLFKGAEVNVEDSQCRTPLYYAVLWSRNDVADLLLERGADPSGRAAADADLRVQAEARLRNEFHRDSRH